MLFFFNFYIQNAFHLDKSVSTIENEKSSIFELQRDKNIKENQDFLKSIGNLNSLFSLKMY